MSEHTVLLSLNCWNGFGTVLSDTEAALGHEGKPPVALPEDEIAGAGGFGHYRCVCSANPVAQSLATVGELADDTRQRFASGALGST